MRRLFVIAGLIWAAGSTSPPAMTADAEPVTTVSAPAGVEITVSPLRIGVVVGDKFIVRSAVRNRGAVSSQPLIAHLNVVSLHDDVYVDPEDWSSSRSSTVPGLTPGGNMGLVWNLQAVNTGSFDIYVVLVPNGPASSGSGPLAVSDRPLHVLVAGRQTLSVGGSLPVIISVPALLGLVLAGSWLWSRRVGPSDR